MHEAKGHFWHLGGMAPWSPKSAYDSLAPGSPSSPSLRRPNESRALFQPGFIIKIAGFMSFLLDFNTQNSLYSVTLNNALVGETKDWDSNLSGIKPSTLLALTTKLGLFTTVSLESTESKCVRYRVWLDRNTCRRIHHGHQSTGVRRSTASDWLDTAECPHTTQTPSSVCSHRQHNFTTFSHRNMNIDKFKLCYTFSIVLREYCSVTSMKTVVHRARN